MNIPMPGHLITSEKEMADASKEIDTLTELVEEHDVIFLLLDSREARWLPTLLCAAKQKICLNVALGFDTYVVMRHGILDYDRAEEVFDYANMGQVDQLGCYYCNDVIAPQDVLFF